MATWPSKRFTYRYESSQDVSIGDIYKIPFGRQQVLGVVRQVNLKGPKPKYAIKSLGAKIALPSALPVYFLQLSDWMAGYYVASARAVWSCLLPSGLKSASKLKPVEFNKPTLKPINLLSADQQTALKEISKHSGTLLHGVTGSGKTEVYLHAIASEIAKNKSTILLVPEIMLTTQLELRLKEHFKNVVVLHSGLSTARRKQLWLSCLGMSQTEPIVVLGPRSALFTPLHNLGLIIVDEEHEPSYKQEAAPRYDATLVAAEITKLAKAKLILGSATPSMRSFALAQIGRIGYAQLKLRHNSSMPNIEIVDIKSAGGEMISKQLAQAISANLKNGLQTLLFLNRRGSARALICNNCGKTTNCPNCNICLNYHADLGKLICHYCNYRTSPVAVCAYCGSTELRFFGDGTKKLEAEIKNLWPKARISRVDRDQSDFEYLQATYNLLRAGEIDIILGTQMISRGLDIDNLSLVGIIDADVSLNIPDFTAGERTFQLLSQTAGRAGRRRELGQVIIQTRNPNNPIIESATHHDYSKFYQLEATNRDKYAYPPYCYLVKLQYVHKNPQTAIGAGNELKRRLAKLKGITVLGPTLHHKRTASRQSIAQIVVKSRTRAVLVELVENLPPNWVADLDPISLI